MNGGKRRFPNRPPNNMRFKTAVELDGDYKSPLLVAPLAVPSVASVISCENRSIRIQISNPVFTLSVMALATASGLALQC